MDGNSWKMIWEPRACRIVDRVRLGWIVSLTDRHELVGTEDGGGIGDDDIGA